MPRKTIILSLLVILFARISCYSSDSHLELRHLDAMPGSYNNLITALHKHSGGMLWFGTSSGLCRYDGYNVKQVNGGITDSTTILNDHILNIHEDCRGKLWLHSSDRYGVYDPVMDRLDIPDSESIVQKFGLEGFISNLTTDANGDIWLALSGKGLYRIRCVDDKVEKVKGIPSTFAEITDMVIKDGELTAVDKRGALLFMDIEGMKVVSTVAPDPIMNGNHLYEMYVDGDDRVWIYQMELLYVYDRRNGKWLNDRIPNHGKIGIMKKIFQDSSGRLWIARDHHGLERILTTDEGLHFVPADPPGMATRNNTITCFMEDSAGTIWMGTYKRGLLSHNESVRKFTLEEFPDVNCVTPASGNDMWVGTDSSGLWIWDTKTGARRRLSDPSFGESEPAITSLTPDGNSNLYIGSFSKGLRLYDGKNFRKITTSSALDDSYVWASEFDSDGRLWCGTLGGGLFMYDPSTGEVVSYKNGTTELLSNYVMSVVLSRDKRVYIGTSYGISVYDPKSGKLKRFRDLFPGIDTYRWKVSQIYEDSRGLLWVGTSNGLKVIDRVHGKVQEIKLNDDGKQRYVLGITQDNGGSMWVSEGAMLINIKVGYDEKTGNLNVVTHAYDNRDGLMECDFNQRSFGKLPDGEIVVGGLYGLNRFSPSEMKFNMIHPRVVFTDLYMGSRLVRPGEEVDGRVVMKNGLADGAEIEFSHNPKEFSIYFSTDDYALPEKTMYEYRLEGYNDEWTFCAPGVNHVTYTNLSPGKYRLLVRAVNGDGYESEEPGELFIRVYPPFWTTTCAIVIYILLGMVAIWGIVKIVSEMERRKFERDMHEEAMRKQEEINQLKFKFFTNVSHDLRTPLSLIVSPLEEMIKESTDERQTRRLTLMRSNAMRLLTLVNQLLDFRKNEVAGLQLNPTEGDVVAFSQNVCNSFVNLSERKNINLTFYSDRESISLMFDEDKLEKIFMNMLGNAFKFTPAGGRVDVSLEQVGEENPVLRIKIADTGVGIKDKDKEHIFERFYQVDDDGESHPHMGSGIGLSMVYEYVKLHDGTVRVTDNVDHGSVFIIDIPIRHIDRKSKGDVCREPKPVRQENVSVRPENVAEAAYANSVEGSSGEGNAVDSRPLALVVDDNPDMTEMLKFELEDDFEVITASDGNEALKVIENVTPAIILTDLMMPGMDGIELCRRLKGNKATVAIPIIILTAKHDLGVKLEGLTLGADDYITKPFNFNVLKLRMKRLVELTAKGARRSLVDPEPEAIKITPLDEQFIEKAVKYVSDNIDSSELSVEELSEVLGMSRVRLYKKIKQITGKTPIEFIRVIRLKRAAQLLRESQLNVSEIAYRTGFNSPKMFSKYFKEEFGILPSVYQDKEGSETNYTV